ncbi:hypothetical protein [Yeosuana marina]|uniref:hypothetical protein n=1 Tax=Yeosuana marina TaxID=1565536 RepID=UPI0030EFA38C|tara:strand:- start:887 stop:1165 length:279 start_codon:yes stop_codon:yes gene_type:complete
MSKYNKLIIGILLDAIGYVSFLIPGIGEFSDIVWAPISAWIMTKLYKGRSGKVAAVINFVEEALPGVDVVPTFTLMWLYTYVFNKKKQLIKI